MAKSKKPIATRTPAPAAAAPAHPTEGMTLAQKIAWFALLATVFLVPLAMSNATWLGFDLPFTYDQFDITKVFVMRGLLLVAFAAWAWHMLVNGGKVRTTPIEWLILAFLAWVAITTVLSIHPPTAFFGKYRRFEGLVSFITYATAYFLVMQFADRPSRVRSIAEAFAFSAIFVSGYGVLQSLGQDPIGWQKLPFEQFRAFSTYGNPDLLGGFLVIALPILAALTFTEKRTVWRAVWWVILLLTVWCWIVAFTRGAWIGGAVGLAFLAFFAFRQRAKLHLVDYGFGTATIGLAALVIVRSLSNPNEVMNFAKRFASIVQFESGSGQTRTQIWRAAIDAIQDRPIFGFGADTFRLVFPMYKPLDYVSAAGYLSVADNVHNYPLQIAAGIGIPGFLLLYSIFVWAGARSWKTVYTADGSMDRLLLAGFWAACAGYVTNLLFGLSVTGSTLLLWIAMAVVVAPTARARIFNRPAWGFYVALAVVVVVVVLEVMNFVYIRADNKYLFARLSSGQTRIDNALRAVQLNPFNDMYRAEVGLAYFEEGFTPALNEAAQLAAAGQNPSNAQEQAKQYLATSEGYLNDVIDFVPAEYDNYVFLAALYNQVGASFGSDEYLEKAVDVANRGIKVERFGPAIRVQKARALVGLGRDEEAVKELRTAYEMDPNYTEAALLLGSSLANTGKGPEALELLQEFESRKPGEAGIADKISQLEASATTK